MHSSSGSTDMGTDLPRPVHVVSLREPVALDARLSDIPTVTAALRWRSAEVKTR